MPEITRRAFAGGLVALSASGARATLAQNAFAPIRAGVGYIDGFQVWFAQELGLFAKAGLTVETQVFNNGSRAAAAVVGGSLTVANGNIVTVAQAYNHGIPILMIAPSIVYDNSKQSVALVVPRGSPIRNAKDLSGKTIGILSLQGILSLTTKVWIDQNGGDSHQVHLVELTPPQMLAAMQRATVACTLMVDPFLTAAITDVRVLGYPEASFGQRHVVTAWFALRSWVAQHQPETKIFAQIIAEAGRWANDPANRERASAIVTKNLGQPIDLGKTIWATTWDNARMQPVLTEAYRYKYISKPMAVSEIVWSG